MYPAEKQQKKDLMKSQYQTSLDQISQFNEDRRDERTERSKQRQNRFLEKMKKNAQMEADKFYANKAANPEPAGEKIEVRESRFKGVSTKIDRKVKEKFAGHF